MTMTRIFEAVNLMFLDQCIIV